MHSNLFVFHKKVSSVIRNSCNEYSIDIEINPEESNAPKKAYRWGKIIKFEKSSRPTCKQQCDQLKYIKPLLQVITIILTLASNVEKVGNVD
jgi:hypothetical protein